MKTTTISSKSVQSNHIRTQHEHVTTSHSRQTFTSRGDNVAAMSSNQSSFTPETGDISTPPQWLQETGASGENIPKMNPTSHHTEVSSVTMHHRQHHESSSVSKTEHIVHKPATDESKSDGPCRYRLTRTRITKRDEETILREKIQAAEENYTESMREKFGSSFQIPPFQSLFGENVKDLDFRHAPPLSGTELTCFISKVREHGRSSYEKEEVHKSANSSRHAHVTADAEIKDDNKHAAVNTSKNERETHQMKDANREQYSERNFKQTTSRTCYNSDGLKAPDKVVSNMLTKPIGEWCLNEFPEKTPPSSPQDLTTPVPPNADSNQTASITAGTGHPTNQESHATTPHVTEPTIPSVSGVQRMLWSQIPEVIQSGILNNMTKKQIIMKEREYEIFTTQITYCASLQVLVEHFYNDPRFTTVKTATNPQHVPLIDSYQKLNLFLNCLKLHLSSQELLQKLLTRWQSQSPMFEEVCDIIRDHFKNEPGYKYYIRNMASQMHMLQALCENEEFRKVLTELESDDRCRKLPLLSFLNAPFKRVTQLRLMLENLIKEMQRERGFCKESVLLNAEEAYNALSNLLYEVEREKKLLDDNECRIMLSTRLIYDTNYKMLDLSCQSLERQDSFRILRPRTFKPWQKSDVVLILLSNLVIATKMKKDRKLHVLDHCSRDKAHVRLSRLFEEEGRKPPRKSASLPDASSSPLQNQNSPSNKGELTPGTIFPNDTLLGETVSLPNPREGDMNVSVDSAQPPASARASVSEKHCQFRLILMENHFGVRRELTLQAAHPGIVMCWSALLPYRLNESTRKKSTKRRSSSFKTCLTSGDQ